MSKIRLLTLFALIVTTVACQSLEQPLNEVAMPYGKRVITPLSAPTKSLKV